MLIDSHCHLDRIDLKPYANDFSRMMNETKTCGVAHMLCVSINLEAFLMMRNLVSQYPQVSISVGIHPNEKLEQNITTDTLLSLASDSKVIAIGETGLDYYRTADNLLSQQHQRFRTHIQAALSCNKPLIIHSRQAPQDTLQILQEEQASNVGGVLHCFTEDWDTAKAALDMNFYISFSGIVTFPNAAKLREVAKLVPVERLLIETDSPYLAPVPHRGKSNEPKFVTHVAKCIAEVRNLSPESLITATGENFMRLFNTSLNLQYIMWCILSIVTAINPQPSQAGWFATQEQEAARSFSHKHYEQAAARFSDPYRKGVAYYRAGDFNAAAASFETVSRPEVILDARYNLGNARFQLGDLIGAIVAYEAVLKQHPKHEDAAFNLALARSMLPATAPTPEPELADKKQKQQDKQEKNQEEKQQAGDSKQEQQEKQEEKQQAGDSKQKQQEKQQASDSKQEQQEKQQAGDSKQEQQEKQQAGDSKQNQENNSSDQNTGKASQAGTEQDQNQQSGTESNQEQTGDSPQKQTSDKQDTAEQSSPEQQKQGAAKEPKQDAEEKGEKGNKEQQDQSSGTKSQEQQEQGPGKEKNLQEQQDGSQPDNNKDKGEGGNKPQLETEGKNKPEPEMKSDGDGNQDKLKQESESKQQAKPDTNSGNQPQPDQAGTAEKPPPTSEQKDGGNGQKENNSQSSQRGQRPPNNQNDLPPDLPPEGQDMAAVPLHQLDQVGQAPGSNEPGDDGASALGGNPAAGPGMAILEQMLEQVEGDPAYLMRNAFLLEEAKYKRSRGGVALEIRPW